ncbi:hypothetical protein [Winslowiella iniecta]|nr:hypothetical protein [Winslowiella iniecta]
MLKINLAAILMVVAFSCFATERDSSTSIAKNVNKERAALLSYQGVLQAYWLPVWSDDGKKNNPEINIRFFIYEKNKKQWKVINIDNGKHKSAGFDVVSYIKRFFLKLPDDFLKYREGHIEQYGVLTVKDLRTYVECDHKYHDAQSVNFTPKWHKVINIDELESTAGCERYPYIMTYTVRPGNSLRHFKLAPSEQAENGEVIPVNTPISKIKTINENWIYAANYDAHSPGLAGRIRGYINKKDIVPIN